MTKYLMNYGLLDVRERLRKNGDKLFKLGTNYALTVIVVLSTTRSAYLAISL